MTQDAADRSKRVLAALVREYIASGEPVASSLLVTAAGLGVSSATVRSILARLEEEGYVQQPHTSAGRIPTDRGYRFYVDLLLDSKRPSRTATAVEARLRREQPGRSARLAAAAGVARAVAGVAQRRLRACGRRTKRRCSTASSSCRSAPLRVLVVIVASGGHVIQKVDRAQRAARRRRPAPGRQLPQRGVLRPAAAPRARGGARAHQRRAARCTTRCCARAMRLATSTFSDLPDDRPIYVEGAASLLDDATGPDGAARCRRCCR